MNKQRKTSHILNVFQYDADGHVVLPASLTLSIAPGAGDNNSKVPTTAWVRTYVTGLTYLTGNQSITVSGDATGSGTTSIALTLANTAVTPGTYGSTTLVPVVTVDSKGRITSVTTAAISGSLTFTGDVTGTGTTGTSTAMTLAASGVTAGTYTKVTVDSKGRVTVGASATTSDISEGTNLYYTDARVLSYLSANTYATQSYVNTQVSNLVASAPATLDTLNELAAALGNDAAFSTTVSTALGNRLRVDINTQGLSATLQGYGRTNLGLGTAATSNTGDFAAASHTHSIANVTGLQTALDGKQASGSYAASVHTHIISDVTGLQTALDGKQASLGFTPYNSTNPSGYISSYTETDTLSSVTSRGNSTSTASIFSSSLAVGNSSHYDSAQFSLDVNGGVLIKNTGKTAQLILQNANPASGGNNGFVQHLVGGTTTGAFASIQTYYGASVAAGTLQLQPNGGSVTIGGNTVYHGGNLPTIPTNNNQLTNGAGYITGVTNISGTAGSAPILTASGALTSQYGNGTIGYSYALTAGQTGLFSTGDNSNAIITISRHPDNYYSQLGFNSNGGLFYRSFSATAINTSQGWQTVWTSSSLTNLNQLTNGPGYITGVTNISGTAGSISGFNNPTTAATANTIVYRDGSGDIYGRYIFGSYHNSSDDVSAGTITYIMAKFGDNYHRSATAAKVQSFLGLGSAAYQNTGAFLSSSGSITVGGYLTVTGAGSSSSIYMSDSDEGNREIHCNSNRIGFLTQAGAWGAYCDDAGNWNAANFSGSSSGTNTGDQTNISGNAATVSDGVYLSGTQSITGIKYFVSNRNTSSDSPSLQAYSNNGSGAIMSFHRGGYYAVNMGLDSDNVFRIGGWSAAVNRLQLDMSGNLTVAGSIAGSNFSGSHSGSSSGTNTGDQTNISGSAGSATSASYAGYLSTAYAGGQQTNPQVYFNNGVGLKAAMTGAWSVWSDTLWINGYSGGDVKQMCALHTLRNGTPRMSISVQAHDATSYGGFYEFITEYNKDTTITTLAYGGATRLYTGSDGTRNSGWAYHNDNGTGLHWPNNGWHFYPKDTADMYLRSGNADASALVMNTAGTNRGYVYANSSNQIGFLSNGRSWTFRVHSDGRTDLGGDTTASIYIPRHLEASTTWGICGCLSLFLGWSSSKVVIGNSASGGHDYANGLGSNSVVSTNPFYCYQDITAYSDSRVKENVEVVENAVEKVKAIRGVTFTRNDVEDKNKRHAGVIAQEVLEVLPEVVSEDLNGHYSVAYGNLNALLIEAIKEQQLQIEELKNKLDSLIQN